MYARKISFTLLAPSIWPVLETAARQVSEPGYSRYLMKKNNNSGVVFEVFENKSEASQKLEALKAVQSLHEQAMAKVTVAEGELL
jgi:hypothetical protein